MKMALMVSLGQTVSAFLGIVKVMGCINSISLGHPLMWCVQSMT